MEELLPQGGCSGRHVGFCRPGCSSQLLSDGTATACLHKVNRARSLIGECERERSRRAPHLVCSAPGEVEIWLVAVATARMASYGLPYRRHTPSRSQHVASCIDNTSSDTSRLRPFSLAHHMIWRAIGPPASAVSLRTSAVWPSLPHPAKLNGYLSTVSRGIDATGPPQT